VSEDPAEPLKLLDCNLCLGLPMLNDYESYATAREMLDAVRPVGVAGGIVWHVAQRDYDPAEGNRLLADAIRGCDALRGCWTLLPQQAREVVIEDFFGRMSSDRIVALRAFPDLHRFRLRRGVFGGFLDELVERRIPLFLSVESAGITWSAVHDLLEEYPGLTCVLADIGIAGVNREVWPLLERYPNVYVESSLLALAEGGMETTVAEFGEDRVLFGTGFPARYAEAAALQLLHADISDSAKAAIAQGNLRRLISEVRL
jgi:hypothetical protein